MTTARFVVSAARRPAPASPMPDVPRVAPARREPPAPAPGDRGGRTLPAGRIAVWQAALAVGFAGLGRGAAATVAAAAVAVVVVVVSAVRVRGEWLSSLGVAYVSYALRRRTRDGDWLPLPRGSVITAAGLVTGTEGVTVVARTGRMELPDLEADAGGPELDVQLVVHRGSGQEPPGAWLAITARRSPETMSDDILRVALDNALRRLRRADRAAGRRAGSVLASAELRATVLRLAHAGPSRESWTTWRSGVIQISLRVRTPRPDALVAALLSAGLGAAATVALRRTRGGTEGVLRVAAPSDAAAERAAARLTELGAASGARLDRLDGRHGPAVLASLPIGGSL